jgi:hypothetical protein
VNLPDRETWLASFNDPGAPTPSTPTATASAPTPPTSTAPPTSHTAAAEPPAGRQQPQKRYQQPPLPSRPIPPPTPSRPLTGPHLSPRTVAGHPPLRGFALPPYPPCPPPPHHRPFPLGPPRSTPAAPWQVDEQTRKRERQKELGEKQAEIDELLDRSYLNNPNKHSPTKRGRTPSERTKAQPTARAPLSTSAPVQQPPRPIPRGAHSRRKKPLPWPEPVAGHPGVPPLPTPALRACGGGEATPAPLPFIPPLPPGTPPRTPQRPPPPAGSPPPEMPARDNGGLRGTSPSHLSCLRTRLLTNGGSGLQCHRHRVRPAPSTAMAPCWT